MEVEITSFFFEIIRIRYFGVLFEEAPSMGLSESRGRELHITKLLRKGHSMK